MAVDLNNPNLEDLMAKLRLMGLSGAQAGYIAGIPVAQRQQALDTYTAEMVPQIGATDLANFQAQRDNANLAYQQGLANLDYQQGNADQNYATGRANLVRQYDQMRTRLPYNFGRRGLANSGIYTQGLQDYADQRTRSLSDYETNRQQQQAGFGLQKANLAGTYRTGMGSLDQMEKARRAQLAAQIKAVQ